MTDHSWIKITPQDLISFFAPGQLESHRRYLSNKQLKDPTENIIQEIISKTRVSLDEPIHPEAAKNTIPAFLKSTVCHLIIEALSSQIPGLEMTPHQIRQAKQSHLDLKNNKSKNTLKQSPQSSYITHKKTRSKTYKKDLNGL